MNDYFNNTQDLLEHTKARAANVEANFDQVAEGFDKFPPRARLFTGSAGFSEDTGIPNAFLLESVTAVTALLDGMEFKFRAKNSNTGPSTLSVNGLGARPVQRTDGTALDAGDIFAGQIVTLTYSQTHNAFQYFSTSASVIAVAQSYAQQATLQAQSAVTSASTATAAAGTATSAAGSASSSAAAAAVSAAQAQQAASDVSDKAPSASPTFTGQVTNSGTSRQAVATISGGVINLASSDEFYGAVTGNVTLSFSNLPASSHSRTIKITFAHSAGTITWPSTVRWPDNRAPSLVTGRTHVFVLTTRDGGSTWQAAALPNYTP